jgi:hypothetical protein
MAETAADLRFLGVKPEFLPEVVPKPYCGRTGYWRTDPPCPAAGRQDTAHPALQLGGEA